MVSDTITNYPDSKAVFLALKDLKEDIDLIERESKTRKELIKEACSFSIPSLLKPLKLFFSKICIWLSIYILGNEIY